MTPESALKVEEAVRLIAFSGFTRYASSMSIDPKLVSVTRELLLARLDKMEAPFLETSFVEATFADKRGILLNKGVIKPLVSLLENRLWLWDAPLYRLKAYGALMDGTAVRAELTNVLRTCGGRVNVPSRVHLPVNDRLDEISIHWFGRAGASIAIRRAITENALRLFFRCLEGADPGLRVEIVGLARRESRLLGVPATLPNPPRRRRLR